MEKMIQYIGNIKKIVMVSCVFWNNFVPSCAFNFRSCAYDFKNKTKFQELRAIRSNLIKPNLCYYRIKIEEFLALQSEFQGPAIIELFFLRSL